jgi:hypothetical protein
MDNTTIHLLPELDRDYLTDKALEVTVARQGSDLYLIIHNFELPAVYNPQIADLLIILPAGYPNANPDMFWTRPDIRLTNGSWPQAADVHEQRGDGSWQRWSRHFPSGQWRPGIDNVRTYLAAIKIELQRGA